MREQYLGRLQSGAAGTMRSVSSLWGGRSGYQESLFDDSEPGGRQESKSHTGSVLSGISTQQASPKPPEAAAKPTAAKVEISSDTWNQAATIRAQLEEELKKEGVARSSPQAQSRQTRPERDRTASAISAGSPTEADGRKRDAEKKRIKERKDKKGSPESLFAVPAEGNFGQDRLDSPKGGGPTGDPMADPWQSSPVVEPAKSASKGSDIWDFAPNSFAWPVQKPAAPQGTAVQVAPASATAAAASLADGFASTSTLPWGPGDEDSPDAPLVVPPEEKNFGVPASVESLEAPTEPLPAPGMFDEAILAALVALPQQSLVGVLRRLAARRPSEVALALGVSAPNSRSAVAAQPTSVQVSAAVPTPPAAVQPVTPAANVNGVPEALEALATPDRGTPMSTQKFINEPSEVLNEPPSEVFREAPDNLADRLANNEVVAAPPSAGAPSTPLSPVSTNTNPLSPVLASADFSAPTSTDPVAAAPDSIWPAGPPSSASGASPFEASSPWPAPLAAPAANVPANGASPQTAASIWPDTSGAGPVQSSSAASPWQTAGASSPWPAAPTGAKNDWPVF